MPHTLQINYFSVLRLLRIYRPLKSTLLLSRYLSFFSFFVSLTLFQISSVMMNKVRCAVCADIVNPRLQRLSRINQSIDLSRQRTFNGYRNNHLDILTTGNAFYDVARSHSLIISLIILPSQKCALYRSHARGDEE